MYTIEFASKRVQKELTCFSKGDRSMILQAIQQLTIDPMPIHLDYGILNKDRDVRRIKCKRARIFYKIADGRIIIGKIEKRDSNSYSARPATWFSMAQ